MLQDHSTACAVIHQEIKMPATTVDGRTGIQRFFLDVDEFSGTMNVDFGHRKSDCAKQLMTRIDKLNSRCSPQKVAELQSDGGTKYVGEPTLVGLRERGITSRNSSPYCQYQNGVAENAMGKIQKGMKAMMFRGNASYRLAVCVETHSISQ